MEVTTVGWRKGFCPGCWGCRDGCDGRGGGCTGKEYSYCREIWKERQEVMAHWTVGSRILKRKVLGNFVLERESMGLAVKLCYIESIYLFKGNVIWVRLVGVYLLCFTGTDYYCSLRWEAMWTSGWNEPFPPLGSANCLCIFLCYHLLSGLQWFMSWLYPLFN